MERVNYSKTDKTATVTLTLDEINHLIAALSVRHDVLTDWINESYTKIDQRTAKETLNERYEIQVLARTLEYIVLDIEGHAFFQHFLKLNLPDDFPA